MFLTAGDPRRDSNAVVFAHLTGKAQTVRPRVAGQSAHDTFGVPELQEAAA
ncbi:hypothetical protein [Streptomyces sp. NPDC051211]|uniref:hypothetical protein n=1 Tax=Streptomyces sp. NPDC051211 TaxID=3154643 RepID=UPI00344BD83F